MKNFRKNIILFAITVLMFGWLFVEPALSQAPPIPAPPPPTQTQCRQPMQSCDDQNPCCSGSCGDEQRGYCPSGTQPTPIPTPSCGGISQPCCAGGSCPADSSLACIGGICSTAITTAPAPPSPTPATPAPIAPTQSGLSPLPPNNPPPGGGSFDVGTFSQFFGQLNANLLGTIRFNTTTGIVGILISLLLPVIFVLAGLGLLFQIIYGGFQIMTAVQDPDKASAGKQRITTAILGFILLLSAYWIAQILQIVFGINILL